MTSTQINDTIIQLESLYNAYNEILDQAKQQLENLEMSDQAIAELARTLGRVDSFKDDVQTAVYRKIIDDLKDLDNNDIFTTYVSSQMLKKIAEQFLSIVKPEIASFVAEEVNKIVESYKVERALEAKLKENDSINSALAIQKALSQVIKDTVKDA